MAHVCSTSGRTQPITMAAAVVHIQRLSGRVPPQELHTARRAQEHLSRYGAAGTVLSQTHTVPALAPAVRQLGAEAQLRSQRMPLLAGKAEVCFLVGLCVGCSTVTCSRTRSVPSDLLSYWLLGSLPAVPYQSFSHDLSCVRVARLYGGQQQLGSLKPLALAAEQAEEVSLATDLLQALCFAVTSVVPAGRISAVYAEPETGGLELTEDNVEMVLDDIRPYLMAGMTGSAA